MPRDLRIDACRGFALVMILIDHIIWNMFRHYTLTNFGFCDAADLFVFLSGYSVWLAYGRTIEKHGPDGGWRRGLNKILRRWVTIYIYQFLTVFSGVLIARLWIHFFNAPKDFIEPILTDSWRWVRSFLIFRTLPEKFNILPLYSVLLALSPIIIGLYRVKPLLLILVSAGFWIGANFFPSFNFHNNLNPAGWFFNPFGWQFIFTLGMLTSVVALKGNGSLKSIRSMKIVASLFLLFAFFQNFPWAEWHLPTLTLFTNLPLNEKTPLAPWRVVDTLCIMYLIFSSERAKTFARSVIVKPLILLGQNSLEVFCAGTVATIIAGVFMTRFGTSFDHQIVSNIIVFAAAFSAAWLKSGAKLKGYRGTRHQRAELSSEA